MYKISSLTGWQALPSMPRLAIKSSSSICRTPTTPVGNRATWRREEASSASPTSGSRDHVVGVPADIQSQGHAAVQDPSDSHARTGAGRGLVYGAFNDHYKIDPAVFRVWMDILKEDAGSVLWFLKHGAEKSLRKSAAKRKVDPDRLVF